MKKKLFYLIGLAAFGFAACSLWERGSSACCIIEATDTCEVCNMAVVNNQHATQIILEEWKILSCLTM